MCTGPHAYIPIPNTARVDLFMTDDGSVIENVFHVRSVSEWDSLSLALLYNVMEAWAGAHYFTALGVQVALTSIKCTDLGSETGAVYESSPFTPMVGAETGGFALPSSATVVIKWITSLRGRSYRGRTYVPGMRTIFVTENTVSPTKVAALVSAASQLWSAIRAGGWTLAVASTCNGGAWRTTGVATDITAWTVDSTIDSQRRRLPGRGK